jgi:hypothetical protein
LGDIKAVYEHGDLTKFAPRSDKRGVDLMSDPLPFRPMWYRGPNAIGDAIDSAKFHSRSHNVVICVYDEAGNVIETHEHAGDLTSSGCVNPHFGVGSSDGFANHKTRKTTG